MMRVPQSALEPAGVHAEKIGELWDVFLAVSVVVWVLVMIALLWALLRRRQAAQLHSDTATQQKRALAVVSVATGLTVFTLFGLLIASIFTSRSIADDGNAQMLLTVTGRQWWWQVDYEHPDKSKRLTTANEIVIPVGTRVHVTLKSPDVIHSLWIPNLNGKQDLIPGKDGTLRLRADRPGVFRGQCAEFCGQQHAKMALHVTALPPNDYGRWIEAQRRPARTPSTPSQKQGLNVFMSAPCPLCHNIAGTDASGKTAPDLTHVASRARIASGTIPNRRDALAQWILDPQHIKPGAYMPPSPLRREELEPLLDYLESLQ
jgi:cytochrome c oxidase subunit II